MVTNTAAANNSAPPNGGLSGGATLINVLTGDAFTRRRDRADAVHHRRRVLGHGCRRRRTSSTPTPCVGAGRQPRRAQIVTGFVQLSGELASTAALQHRTSSTSSCSTSPTLSGTDWVVTFPTKHNFVTDTGGDAAVPEQVGQVGLVRRHRHRPCTTAKKARSGSRRVRTSRRRLRRQAGPALCWESNIRHDSDPASQRAGFGEQVHHLDERSERLDESCPFRAGAVNVATAATVYDPMTGSAAPRPS